MLNYIKAGWNTTRNHPWIISVLFLYQLIWGIFIFKFIQSIVLPLLHRYPGEELNETSLQIFLAESQFQLLKTDLAHSFLWIFLTLILVRMILTPLLNAGIYYSIHHPGTKQIGPFFQGIRAMGKPFAIIYSLQLLFLLSPLFGIYIYIKHIFVTQSHNYESLFLAVLPFLLGYLVYGSFIRLYFMFIQFGKVSHSSLFNTIKMTFRYLLPIMGISSLLMLFLGLISLISLSISMVWAGFLAVLIHQLYHLVKVLFKVWEISSQYQLWSSKTTL